MTLLHSKFSEVADRLTDVDGLLRDGQERFLFDMVQQLPEDAVIVEIGSFMGRSTLSMGFACLGTRRMIYSIDTWNGNDVDFPIHDFYLSWARNIMRSGLEQHVFPLVGHSGVVMPLWETVTNGKKIDLVLIDGSHQYRDVLADFYHSYPHVRPGGLILLHDITEQGWPGPNQVWQEVVSPVLVDHQYCSTLGAGRKSGPLPQWAALYCDKALLARQDSTSHVQHRDLGILERFLDRVEREVYPEPPSTLHSELTLKALDNLDKVFPMRPGMRVLDVGCGQGPALEYFVSKGMACLGVTLGDEDIAACRIKGLDVRKMDQSFLTLPDGSQDLVWARHVIEHSVFPLFTLHGFNRVLRQGGMLYLEVPAPETSCHHERNPNHYSVFTKGCWQALLERSGFQIVADADYSFDVAAGPDLYWGFYCLKLAQA